MFCIGIINTVSKMCPVKLQSVEMDLSKILKAQVLVHFFFNILAFSSNVILLAHQKLYQLRDEQKIIFIIIISN